MKRCTRRKHVKERGSQFCDCGALMLGMTAARNAVVITVVDPVQAETLAKIKEATA